MLDLADSTVMTFVHITQHAVLMGVIMLRQLELQDLTPVCIADLAWFAGAKASYSSRVQGCYSRHI